MHVMRRSTQIHELGVRLDGCSMSTSTLSRDSLVGATGIIMRMPRLLFLYCSHSPLCKCISDIHQHRMLQPRGQGLVESRNFQLHHSLGRTISSICNVRRRQCAPLTGRLSMWHVLTEDCWFKALFRTRDSLHCSMQG